MTPSKPFCRTVIVVDSVATNDVTISPAPSSSKEQAEAVVATSSTAPIVLPCTTTLAPSAGNASSPGTAQFSPNGTAHATPLALHPASQNVVVSLEPLASHAISTPPAHVDAFAA